MNALLCAVSSGSCIVSNRGEVRLLLLQPSLHSPSLIVQSFSVARPLESLAATEA